MPNSKRAAFVACLLLSALALPGCGSAQLGPPLVGDGRETHVKTLDLKLSVPVGFEKKKSGVWTLDSGGARHAMLWVERKDLPEDGVAGFVDRTVKHVGKGGVAGVTRREKLQLGDLEGHFVEAVTVIGSQRSAAMQLMVGAEDGLYLLSIVATVDTMRRNRKAFEACVKSLRVPRR
jgi:hypothetical protein